jgi:hypothetical protein
MRNHLGLIGKQKRIPLVNRIIILSLLSGLLIQCHQSREPAPFLHYPGFRAHCIFTEDFSGPSSQWRAEGAGITRLTADSGLFIQPTLDTVGVMIWLDQDFNENYQLEYQVEFHDTIGLHLLFTSAAGLHDEDLFDVDREPYGYYETYSQGNLNNYQISLHCYDLDGQHHASSRLRKNPGNILLSHVPTDPCYSNRNYTIDFIKIGKRLQLFVDGERYHDFKDKIDRNSLYEQGKVGFWFQGKPSQFSVTLRKIRVYKLIPS